MGFLHGQFPGGMGSLTIGYGKQVLPVNRLQIDIHPAHPVSHLVKTRNLKCLICFQSDVCDRKPEKIGYRQVQGRDRTDGFTGRRSPFAGSWSPAGVRFEYITPVG